MEILIHGKDSEISRPRSVAATSGTLREELRMRDSDQEQTSRQSLAGCIAQRSGCHAVRNGYRALPVAALVVMAAFLLALAPRARADELTDLKETIKKLEAGVQALEAEKGAAKAAPASAPPAAPAPAEAKAPVAPVQPLPASAAAPYIPPATMKGDQDAVQRVDNAPIDPSLKGFFKIPGTDTIMKVGGYAKLDFIFDTKPIGPFDYFVTSAIPTSGPGTQFGTEFTAQAKQTRLNIDWRRDTEAGPARLYFEADLLGNARSNCPPANY